jgi:hypothetical protein
MVRVLATSVSIVSFSGTPFAAEPAAADAAAHAQRVLAAARQALGGEGALAAVHSLSLEGQLRRRIAGEDGEQEMSGDVRVDSLLPDRYLRVDTVSPMPGMPGIPLATGLDGDEVWSGALPVASGMNVVIRAPAPEREREGHLKDRILR